MSDTTQAFEDTPVNENEEVLSHSEEEKEQLSPAEMAREYVANSFKTDGTSTPSESTDVDSEIAENASTADFLENYSEFSEKRIYSKNLSDADYYWDNDSARRDEYEKKYGENAREEFEKHYEEVADEQRQLAEEETDKIILGSGIGDIFYDNEQIEEVGGATMEVTLETLGGKQIMGDLWTDATRSARQASVESDTFINDKGEKVELKDGEEFMSWDAAEGLILNDRYLSEDGRKITGFQYQNGMDEYSRTRGSLKALYEGDIPSGEIVSFWDVSDSPLASNGLNNHWVTDVPKSAARTVISLTSDLVIGTAEAMNSIATLLDTDDSSNGFIEGSRDFITHLSRYKMSQTDYDQQNMITWANSLDLIGQVAGQLALAGRIAKGVGKLSASLFQSNRILTAAQAAQAAGRTRSAAKLFKAYERTLGKPARMASLTAMSLMAGSSLKDEARQKGFSEDETAALFLAFLPAMYQASRLSALLDNGISTATKQGAMKEAIVDMIAVVDPATLGSNRSKFAFAKQVVGKINNNLSKVANKARLDKSLAGYGSAAMNEAMEEEVELAMEEGLKHLWTSIARVTHEDPRKRPKFDTIWDEGYFKKLAPEILMSGVGGALGGGMAKMAKMGGVDEDTLPWQGDDQSKLKAIALKGGRDEYLFLKTLKKSYDQGALGSQDYLIERDDKGKLIKTPEDRTDNPTPTIAEANYRAMLFQYNYYKAQIGTFQGTFDEFTDKHPELVEGLDVKEELHKRVKENFDSLNKLYAGANPVNRSESRNASRGQDTEAPAATTEATRNQRNRNRSTDQVNNGAEPTTTTNERVEGVAETTSENQVITPEAITRAAVLGVSEIQAQEILDREELMNDMMVGKTIEEDYINSVLKSKPEFSFLNGTEDTPEEIKKYFGKGGPVEFLNKLHLSDARLRTEIAQKYEDFSARSTEVKEIVNQANSVADLESILNMRMGDESIPLEVEDINMLRSKVKDVANSMVTPEEYTQSALNIYQSHGVSEITSSLFISELSGKLMDKMMEGQDTDEALREMLENNTEDFYKYSLYKKIESNLAENDVNRLVNLEVTDDIDTFREKLLESYDSMTIDSVKLASQDPEGTEPFEVIIAEAMDNSDTSLSYVMDDADPVAVKVRPISAKVDEIANNISENVPRKVGETQVEFYATDFSTDRDDTPVSRDNNLLMKAFQMEATELEKVGDYEIFRNKQGATELLNTVKARKAQISVIKDLMSSGALFKLRAHNANIFSGEEYYSPLEQDKYTKFSKYISGFVIDPVEYNLLNNKETLTTEEQEKFDKMKSDFGQLSVDIPIQLDEAERIANKLLNLAEKSADGARMAAVYNNSVLHFADKITKALWKADLSSHPELSNMVINMGAIETTDVSDKATVKAWQDIRTIAKLLNELDTDSKTAIFESMKEINNDKIRGGVQNVVAFLAADYGAFSKHFKRSTTDQGSKQSNPEAPILPTIDQEMAAFSAYAFATGESDYITQRSGNNIKEALFVPGSLGTGKTTMILGYAMQSIQSELDAQTANHFASGELTGNLKDYNKVMLCANNIDQQENMEQLAGTEFGIRIKRGASRTSFNLNELLSTLTKDDAYDALKDTSVIAYDEATFIQAIQGEDSDFTTIIDAIKKLNERRVGNKLAPIKFIGLGDSKQGGFLEGMTPGKENVHIEYENMGDKQTIADINVARAPELDFSFRAYVDELTSFTAQLKKFDMSRTSSAMFGKVPDVLNSVYGTISNDTRNRYGGVEMVNDGLKNIYNDATLVEHIKDQIAESKKNGETFTVGVVDQFTSIEELPVGPLRELAVANPDSFKVRTMSQAQGGEYDYTLLNLPEDFIGMLSDFNPQDYIKYQLLGTMVGRSRFYARVVMSDKTNTNSVGGRVAMANMDLNEEFRKKWKDVRDAASVGIVASESTSEEIDSSATVDPVDPIEQSAKNEKQDSENDKTLLEVRERMIKGLGKVEIQAEEIALKDGQGALLDEFTDVLNSVSEDFGIDLYNDSVMAELMHELETEYKDPAATQDDKLESFRRFSALKAVRELKSSLFQDQANTLQNTAAKGMFNNDSEPDDAVDDKFGNAADISDRAKMLDDNGISIFYSRITKLGRTARGDESSRLKYFYAADIYGNDGNIFDSEDVAFHTNAAIGAGPDGKKAMRNYKYSIVSYNYAVRIDEDRKVTRNGVSQKGPFMAVSHAIMGTDKATGKKFIVGMLPGTWRMDDDSPSSKVFGEREAQINALQKEFSKTVTPSTTGDYADASVFTEAFGATIPNGSIGGRQASVTSNDRNVDPRDGLTTRDRKLTNALKYTGSVYLETDVTYDIDKILKGISPGALVQTSKHLRGELANLIGDSDVEEKAYVENMPLQTSDGETVAVNNFEDALVGKTMIDVDAFKQLVKDKVIVNTSGIDKPITKVTDIDGRDHYTFVINANGRYIPFTTSDKSGFVPMYGFDKNGTPVTDNAQLETDLELLRLSDIINSNGIDSEMILTEDSVSEAPLEHVREGLADMLKYSAEEFDKEIGATSKTNMASAFNKSRATTSFDKHKVTLNTFLKMMDQRGAGVSFSQPLVFTKDNTNAKTLGGSDAGKVFMFYTHKQSKDYDLSDPSVIQGLESKFGEIGKSLDSSAEVTAETIQQHLGDGIGVIQLDYNYTSMANMMEHFKRSQEGDMSSFNKLIAPTGSAVNRRLVSFIAELSDLFQTNYSGMSDSEQSYSRIKQLREANAVEDDEGNPQPIRVLNESKKAELLKYLNTLQNSEDINQRNAFRHLARTVYFATANSNMGSLILDSQLPGDYSPRVRNLFVHDDSDRLVALDRLKEDITDKELDELKELGIAVEGEDGKITISRDDFLAVGTTSRREEHETIGRLLTKNGKPLVFPRHPKRDVITYVPASEVTHHALQDLNLEETFSFDVTNFLKLLQEGGEDYITEQTATETVKVLDKLLSDYTNPGTLNKGLRIPPSYSNRTDSDSAWGFLNLGESTDNTNKTATFFNGDSALGENLLTNIKDISGPGLYTDTNAIAAALVQSSVDPSSDQDSGRDAKMLEEKLKNVATEVDNILPEAIGKITNARKVKNAESHAKRAKRIVENVLKTYVEFGGSDADLVDIRQNAYAKIDAELENTKTRLNKTKKSKADPLTMEQLRKGESPFPAELRKVLVRTNPKEMAKIDKYLAMLPIAVDTAFIIRQQERTNAVTATLSKDISEAINNALNPTFEALAKETNLGSPASITAAINYVADNDVKVDKPTTQQTQKALELLNNFSDAALTNKTGLLRIMLTTDSETDKALIKKFLDAKLDSNLDTVGLKFRIMRALRSEGYIIPDVEGITAVEHLRVNDPIEFSTFMQRDDVKALLQKAQDFTIIKLYSGTSDANSIVAEFTNDVNDIMSDNMGAVDKKNYLQALLDLVPMQFDPEGAETELVKQLISQNMAILETEMNGGSIDMSSIVKNSTDYVEIADSATKALIDNALEYVDNLVTAGTLNVEAIMLALNSKEYVSDQYISEFTEMLNFLETNFSETDADTVGDFLDNLKSNIHSKNNNNC